LIYQAAHKNTVVLPNDENPQNSDDPRPIVAIFGSITSGLGCWLDQQLQPLCKKLPTYRKSSFDLTELLKELPDLPDGAQLNVYQH
jgi:hypothetical protein